MVIDRLAKKLFLSEKITYASISSNTLQAKHFDTSRNNFVKNAKIAVKSAVFLLKYRFTILENKTALILKSHQTNSKQRGS